jgi:hypothetical protein
LESCFTLSKKLAKSINQGAITGGDMSYFSQGSRSSP